jgi:uncharacterized protein GlcG (DUF336 family)
MPALTKDLSTMKNGFVLACALALGVEFAASATLSDSSGLPGDHGRPGDGVAAINPAPRPSGGPPRTKERAPDIDLAVIAAHAIAEGCKQYPLGVAVVNAAGEPILIYLPNGSEPGHGYMALRKAYTAITFNAPTSQIRPKAQQDADTAAKVRANPNLVAYSGGILLKAGDTTIGAIGVSGAEPGAHDEECALIGLEKINNRLK